MAGVTARWSPAGRLGLGIIAAIAVTGLVSVVLGGDRHRLPSGGSLEAPSATHPLGTDVLGVDVLAQLARGAATSLVLAAAAGIVAGLGGALFGVLAADRGGRFDQAALWVADAAMALPQIPAMIVIGVVAGPGLVTVFVAIVLFAWAGPFRDVRAQASPIAVSAAVAASRSFGARFTLTFRRHFAAALAPLMVVAMVRIAGRAVIAEAALTFLGLGDPRVASWGSMLQEALGFDGIFSTEYWRWWLVPPLVMIITLVVAIALTGREVERRLDERGSTW
jgi:peptide/nickel transport system permease protein